jgi:hypothetical protein
MKFICNTVVCNTAVPFSCFILLEMSLQSGCHKHILNTGNISSLFSLCFAVGQIKRQIHLPLSLQLWGETGCMQRTTIAVMALQVCLKVNTTSPSSYI